MDGTEPQKNSHENSYHTNLFMKQISFLRKAITLYRYILQTCSRTIAMHIYYTAKNDQISEYFHNFGNIWKVDVSGLINFP